MGTVSALCNKNWCHWIDNVNNRLFVVVTVFVNQGTAHYKCIQIRVAVGQPVCVDCNIGALR